MNGDTKALRSSVKLRARQAITRMLRPCMMASGVMLALQMAALYFKMNAGGVLGYFLLNAADYTTATGIWMAEGGFTAVLRLEMAGALFALPLSFGQLGTFIVVNGIVFIITMPLLMGVLEHYHAILHERVNPLFAIFRWYLDLRLTAKAVGLGLVLALVKWSTRVVGALPGLALFVWATGSTQLESAAVSGLMFLASVLILAGAAAGYWIYTLVLPAQYLLAREPDASVTHVLRAGIQVFQGRRWDYFVFRLSFFLWYFLVNATYGAMGIFVMPYTELSNLLYIQAAVDPAGTQDVPAQS